MLIVILADYRYFDVVCVGVSVKSGLMGTFYSSIGHLYSSIGYNIWCVLLLDNISSQSFIPS